MVKKMGYREITPSGLPSTIYSYVCAIKQVMRKEAIDTWSELADEIGRLVLDYGEYGKFRDFGAKSNATVINALERFEDYLRVEFGFVAQRVWRDSKKEEPKNTITEIQDIKISTYFCFFDFLFIRRCNQKSCFVGW